MLTTGAMIRIGKTYGNLMVDLRATNTKLVARTRRIVTLLTGASEEEAERLVAAADGELKTAVVSRARGVSPAEARRLLAEAGGHLRRAVGDAPLRSRGADDGGR
jgi:N-acetylmuramic acid 6-phosphate etherase